MYWEKQNKLRQILTFKGRKKKIEYTSIDSFLVVILLIFHSLIRDYKREYINFNSFIQPYNLLEMFLN